MYKTANAHYREIFGCKVYKLSLDGGFTCPNRDGTVGYGGCSFCSGQGSGDFAAKPGVSVTDQLHRAKAWVEQKNKGGKYMAYFQAFTGTYAPVARLRQMYLEAIAPEEIVGLTIGTRPDCLPQETVSLLGELHRIKPVTVELGLQTVHEETARRIRRGYPTAVYFDALRRLKAVGVEVVTHIILGLPGETPEMAEETTRQAVLAGTDGVKFHLLHVLKGTTLEEDYRRGEFTCLELEEYAAILTRCIRILPPHVVVHRITGDGAKRDLVAPLWSGDKKRVMNYLKGYLARELAQQED